MNINPGLTGDGGGLPEAGTTTDASTASDTGVVAPADSGGLDATTLDSSVPDSGRPDTSVTVVDAGTDVSDTGTTGSDAGIGLEGTGLTPLPINGQSLDTPNGAWKYHEFPDTFCRNGTKAGITVFKNSASKKLMFFFEGGGACFDEASCLTNPAAVDAMDRAGPAGGILDRSNPANPVKDWNFVYVPYCTGDVFGGTNPSGMVDSLFNPGPHKFVGFLNTQAFLNRVVPTFPDMNDVLVTGVSAGGFGASTSVVLIQRAFPNIKGKLLNDSGPPMPGSVLASCLQKQWRELWGYDNSILKDCGAACPNKDDYTMDYGLYLAKTFGNRYSGLIESAQDGIISAFFGAGNPAQGSTTPCAGFGLGEAIAGPKFQMGLLEFREKVKAYTNFGTFFPQGTQHTWLMGASFYTGEVGGVKMVDWVTDIINEKGTKHVGP